MSWHSCHTLLSSHQQNRSASSSWLTTHLESHWLCHVAKVFCCMLFLPASQGSRPLAAKQNIALTAAVHPVFGGVAAERKKRQHAASQEAEQPGGEVCDETCLLQGKECGVYGQYTIDQSLLMEAHPVTGVMCFHCLRAQRDTMAVTCRSLRNHIINQTFSIAIVKTSASVQAWAHKRDTPC